MALTELREAVRGLTLVIRSFSSGNRKMLCSGLTVDGGVSGTRG